jgi:heme exporter protein A
MAGQAAGLPCAIEVTGLTKSYGTHVALRGVDLKVRPGERVALFGPNGAGKTTIIKIISTIVKPTAGKILVEGFDLKEKAEEARRRIGLVSHSTFLYGHLSIYENLDFYARIYDISDRKSRIGEVVADVEMTQRMHDRVDSLSRGMQQRVSIARAILHKPTLMLLDEPETGLDQRSSSIVWSALSGTDSVKRTMIVITHSLERGLELSDRVIILVRGRIAFDGPTSGLDLDSLRDLYNQHTGARA